MQPTSDKIFVEKQKAESQSQFELPSSDQYKVVAVGSDVTVCKVGDFVLFNNYHEYEFDDQTYIRVNEGDVDGVCSGK